MPENPNNSTTPSTYSTSPSEKPTSTHPPTPAQGTSNKSNPINFGIVAGVIAGILVAVVIITLFMLWYCWLIIRKVVSNILNIVKCWLSCLLQQFVRKVKPPPEPEVRPAVILGYIKDKYLLHYVLITERAPRPKKVANSRCFILWWWWSRRN